MDEKITKALSPRLPETTLADQTLSLSRSKVAGL